MKKLLTILILFCSVVCFSQAPRQLNAYNPSTQVNFLGTMATDSGLVFRTNFADTTTANLGWIKNIRNVLITINDTLYKRSNDVTHWMQVGSGSGGGSTIYTGDGSLSGDRTIDLNGHGIGFVQGGSRAYLDLNPSPGNENSSLLAFNETGKNSGKLSLQGTDTTSEFYVYCDFNDATKIAQIQGNANSTEATLEYTADTHTFNGVHFNIANLQNFANNAAAITGGLNVGDLYYTNTAGDGVLKIVL